VKCRVVSHPNLYCIWGSFPFMWFPRAALLGFAAQLPFMSPPPTNVSSRNMSTIREFSFKAGNDRLTPKDLIELPRPDVGKANPAGDLVLASVSKYSFADKK
jgi:hypothetical protein